MTTTTNDIISADAVHGENMQRPGYRREHYRTQLANAVAIKVIQYRVDHNMSQADLARILNMKQPNVARLEAGDHAPTLAVLEKLSRVLGIDLSIDITPDKVELRTAAG